tara:strand:+ start:931 stop:1173 length:243 start_codon:yes stop_codon:yes gene_type:complete
MKAKLLTILLAVFISCSDNCDTSYYPSPPYLEPYHAEYGNDWIKYVYLCRDGFSNEIVTYTIVEDCWQRYIEYQYNYLCD